MNKVLCYFLKIKKLVSLFCFIMSGFFGHNWHLEIPGQRLNFRHSSAQSHCSDSGVSLILYTTREPSPTSFHCQT